MIGRQDSSVVPAPEPSAASVAEVEYLRGYENGYAAAYNDAIRQLRSGGNNAQADVVREELWHQLWKAKIEYVHACEPWPTQAEASEPHEAEAWRRGYEPRVEFGWHCLTCGAEGTAFSATVAENLAAAHAKTSESQDSAQAATAEATP